MTPSMHLSAIKAAYAARPDAEMIFHDLDRAFSLGHEFGINRAANVVDQCNKQGPYNAIGPRLAYGRYELWKSSRSPLGTQTFWMSHDRDHAPSRLVLENVVKNPEEGSLTDIQLEQLRLPSSVRLTLVFADEGSAVAAFENLRVQIERGHVFFQFGDVSPMKKQIQ